MKCPVCPFPEVPREADKCPNCGVDLGAIRRVDDLAQALGYRAKARAASGALEEAVSLAHGAMVLDGQSTREQVLLGKLLWKSRRRHEALTHFERAAQIAPDDPAIEELIECAKSHLRRERLQRGALVVVLSLTIVGLVGWCLISYARANDSFRIAYRANEDLRVIKVSLAEQQASLAEANAAAKGYSEKHTHTDEDYDSISGKLKDMKTELSAYQKDHAMDNASAEILKAKAAEHGAFVARMEARTALLARVAEKLDSLGGLLVEGGPGSVRVRFKEGVFDRGSARITEGARKSIGAAAQTMASFGFPLNVEFRGHTDDSPVGPGSVYPDNWTLALARATAAVTEFENQVGTAPICLSASSRGELSPPFPNDSAENRRRNLTVAMVITVDIDEVPAR